ncbi:MAG: toprim domain-containing protein [Parvularculaceae bacterium]|nr:toprim domain-containing protein [Parvularculaceae bacterium]
MFDPSSEIARRLAERANDVCRLYLPNGKRVGDYWIVGDARGAKGRSLFVRLVGPPSGKGAAGKWQDAATGDHGDLLDLIAAACRFKNHRDARDEARRFLNMSSLLPSLTACRIRRDRTQAAQRLFNASQRIAGTLAEIYLGGRGIPCVAGLGALRFHPRCTYREQADARPEPWPAIIAAVKNDDGVVTGVLRTWLARDGRSKAPLAAPRKALGSLAGNAVRFGDTQDILIVGEGIETVLSVRSVLPFMPFAAALSAQHLSMFRVPSTVMRLYIAVDRDDAGFRAADVLRRRAIEAGVNAMLLLPRRKDFNDDLVNASVDALTASLAPQLALQDRVALRQFR